MSRTKEIRESLETRREIEILLERLNLEALREDLNFFTLFRRNVVSPG
jgi:hypothetical protein